jgi:ubiquinone/menaquinone biosynthesis C-methylase UbiE
MESYLYDDLYALEEQHWWHKAKRELILRLLPQYITRKRIKILDIGCGTGKNVETFSQFGESWGLDISTRAIAYGKKRGLQHLARGTAEKTGLRAQSFDVVTLLDVLEHTDDVKSLKEVHRILKPQGHIVITVPAYQWLFSRWDEVLHHKRRYNKSGLEQILHDTGYTVEKISYVYSFLIIPIIVVRTIKSLFFSRSYGSDFRLSSPYINSFMLAMCRIEAGIIQQGYVSFGTSLVCIARKIPSH